MDAAAGYYSMGAIRKMTLGNGLTETSAINSRLQPCRTNFNSSNSVLGGCNDPLPTKTIQDFKYGFYFGSVNNGNLASMTAVGVESFNRGYAYDWLNRLQTASAPGETCEGLAWVYDSWGNRTQQNATAGSCLGWQAPVNALNQLTGAPYQYDAAGDMAYDGVHSYSYDAEGRMVSVDSGNTAAYVYDAEGRRVRKSGSGVSSTTDYVYDLNGDVVSEWASAATFNALYAYLNGQLLTQYRNSTTYFVHKDHLGSTRLVTTRGGGVYESDDFLPFGERIASSSNPGVLSSGFEAISTLVNNPGFEQVTTTNVTVQNAGFEGNAAQGWAFGYWGAAASITNVQARSGSYSLAQTGSTEGGSYQDVSGLIAGQCYQVSVWVRADAGTTAQAMLWLHDTTGANTLQSSLLTPGQGWQPISLMYVADSTGALRIHLHYRPGAGTIYYDDVQVIQTSAQNWTVGYWGATSFVTSASLRSGAHSLAQSGSIEGGSYQDVGGLVAGQSYQVSVWTRADSGTTAQMMLYLHDTTGANASQSSLLTPGQTWQQIALNYVADSTGMVRIHLHYHPGSGTIYYDDVQIVQNSAQGWTLGYWGAASSITASQTHSGGFSLAQTGSVEGGSFQDVTGLISGQSYNVSVWTRADAGTTAQMYLWVHDTNGTNGSQTTAITPGQTWQQVTINYVADNTGAIRIHLHYRPGAGTVYYDDVQIVSQSSSGDVVTHKFTGDEHDAESNLEHTPFRQLSTTQGRWLSPDPYLGSMDLTNPQSLNRYSYVNNNPLRAIDPTGLNCVWDDGSMDDAPIDGGIDEGGCWSSGGSWAGETITVNGSGDNGQLLPGDCAEVFVDGVYEGTTCTISIPTGGGQNGSRAAGGKPAANTGLKQTVCSALPQGRVTSLNGSVGLVGGQQGSVQQVVNYNDGEVNNFLTGGLQVGWNGVASASASTGFIYKPGGRFVNSDFSGGFNNVSGAVPEGPGGSASWASNGVKVVQGGFGVTVLPTATGTYSYTWTSKPKPGGNILSNLPSPLGVFDLTIYALRNAAGC